MTALPIWIQTSVISSESLRTIPSHSPRSEIWKWRWRDLAQDIKRHLIDIGRIESGRVTYNQEDVGVVSVLENVGRRVARLGGHEQGARALRHLAFRCLDGLVSEAADVDISFLAAGRSGASVCRLDISGGGEPSQAFVLKFGFDRGALEQELAATELPAGSRNRPRSWLWSAICRAMSADFMP